MELIGLKVKHTVFGVGTITEKDGNYITVEFAAKTTKFVYPDAFEKFIKAEEPSVQKQLKYWVMLKKIIGITGIINTEKV